MENIERQVEMLVLRNGELWVVLEFCGYFIYILQYNYRVFRYLEIKVSRYYLIDIVNFRLIYEKQMFYDMDVYIDVEIRTIYAVGYTYRDIQRVILLKRICYVIIERFLFIYYSIDRYSCVNIEVYSRLQIVQLGVFFFGSGVGCLFVFLFYVLLQRCLWEIYIVSLWEVCSQVFGFEFSQVSSSFFWYYRVQFRLC